MKNSDGEKKNPQANNKSLATTVEYNVYGGRNPILLRIFRQASFWTSGLIQLFQAK